MIRNGNCAWVKIFDVSQIKVKLVKPEEVLGGLKKGLSLPSSKNSFFAQNLKPTSLNMEQQYTIFYNFKMQAWLELDAIDHFAWGLVTDALLLMAGEEVGCSIFVF